ncbi:hypothetical protein HDV06_003888 [Boothiomyces sp. JEL0866]|nr:hypothetical protein HDV06_003888 [Boothiomyces sp. JEL0866]
MKRIQRGFKSSIIAAKLANQEKPRLSLKERMAAASQQSNAPANSTFTVPKFYVKPKDLSKPDLSKELTGNNNTTLEYQPPSIVDTSNANTSDNSKRETLKYRLPNLKTSFRSTTKNDKHAITETDFRNKRPQKSPRNNQRAGTPVKSPNKKEEIDKVEQDQEIAVVDENPITIVEAIDEDLETKKVHKKDLQRDKEKRLRELERKAAAKAKAKAVKSKAKNINIPNFITIANLGNLLGVNYCKLR